MPPYPWLFDGGPNQPTQEGLDVLDYLQSLGRARQLSGFDRQTLASSIQPETADMAMASGPSARATPPAVPIAMMGGYSLSAPVLHPASDPDDLQEGEPRWNPFRRELCFVSWIRGEGRWQSFRESIAETGKPDCCPLLRRTIEQRAVEWSRWIGHAALAPAAHRRLARSGCLHR